jgi:hypothetical protein
MCHSLYAKNFVNTSPACRFFAADTLEAWMAETKALTFGRLASSRTGAASQERAMVHKVCTKALRPSVEVRVGMVCDRHYMSRTIPQWDLNVPQSLRQEFRQHVARLPLLRRRHTGGVDGGNQGLDLRTARLVANRCGITRASHGAQGLHQSSSAISRSEGRHGL